jgi:hypothetical protein
MRSRRFVAPALLFAIAGCHPGGAGGPAIAPAPAPVQAPPPASAAAPSPSPTPAAAAAAAPGEAPREWQRLDMATDHVPGISVDRAERELFGGRAPTHTVIVAVIDGGLDTANVDLRPNLWTNPHPGADGYPGDLHGWDFIGGPDGRDVHWDTDELTRVAVRCENKAGVSDPLPPAIAARCHQIDSEFTRRRSDDQQELQQAEAIKDALAQAIPLLQRAAGTDSLTPTRVAAIVPADSATTRARGLYLALAEHGITAAMIDEAVTHFRSGLDYGLNPSFNPRPIVGDDYRDVNQSHYGNADVTGPDAEHGTHVSGIIGATRDDHDGVDGIGGAVHIIMVRAIPDGDERDKDVANAIRYAVDHGARIINMSFGKGFSPEKPAVDAAVRYADAHGVLMIHAAGNDGADEDQSPNFPNPRYADGGQAQNWIEVGASSWQGAITATIGWMSSPPASTSCRRCPATASSARAEPAWPRPSSADWPRSSSRTIPR